MSKRMLLAGFVALTVVMARCETEKEFFFKDNDSIVFLGDSITQQKLYTTYIEAYTLTRFPDWRFRFRNSGWSGDTSWLRNRFKTEIVKVLKAEGARVALLTPQPIEDKTPAEHDQNVKVKDGTLGFDRLDHALPMPVDAKATAALTLAPVSEDLNRYMLKVAGLKAAQYELSIDGLKVGVYSSGQLAQGVNLATVATPNAAQALQVLDLVFKKNDVYFERWRKVQLAGGAAEKLAELDKRITEFETQIDAARKPRRQHFELKPVSGK